MLMLLPLFGFARTAGAPVPKTKLVSIINEYKNYEGVEVVKVGSLGTRALKSMIRLASLSENAPDMRDAMRIISGIRKMLVVDFEDCEPAVRERLARKLQGALDGADLLMEVKDGGTGLMMYGVVAEGSSTVRDFVLYSPEDCSLICLFGSLSLNAVSKLATSVR